MNPELRLVFGPDEDGVLVPERIVLVFEGGKAVYAGLDEHVGKTLYHSLGVCYAGDLDMLEWHGEQLSELDPRRYPSDGLGRRPAEETG